MRVLALSCVSNWLSAPASRTLLGALLRTLFVRCSYTSPPRQLCLLFYLSKIWLSLLLLLWNSCQHSVLCDPQLPLPSGMCVRFQRWWAMAAAVPSDVCRTHMCGWRGSWQGFVTSGTLLWLRRRSLGT